MTHGSLFSGIGGFDLAAEWMGWENMFHCEWNEFGQKILNYYWPKAKSYGDITKTDFNEWCGKIDIVSGGFPCQPYSLAGKRKGKEDDRHLWPEMLRAIREIQPRWVVGENVLGLVNWSGGLVFHEVQADLEAAGYEVWPYVLPACGVNAPHRRDRIWFVAHSINNRHKARRNKEAEKNGIQGISGTAMDTREFNRAGISSITPNTNSDGQHGCNSEHEINTSEGRVNAQCNTFQGLDNGDVTNTESERHPGKHTWDKEFSAQVGPGLHGRNSIDFSGCGSWQNFPTQPPICTGNDGFPPKLDGITFSKWRNESIKAAGNAIVPQVVYQIFKAIEQYEKLK